MVLETPKEGSRASAAIEPDPMDLENLRMIRELMTGPTP
jgi:hypothetical protein